MDNQNIIKKWMPILMFNTKIGKVPEKYHQKCAEKLEQIEEKFIKNHDDDMFKICLCECVKSYISGVEYEIPEIVKIKIL